MSVLTVNQDIVITLDKVRAKLEKRSVAKGFRRVYNHLTWPIDEPDIQKLLQIIQRDTQIFHFALTVRGTAILSQIAKQASQMLRASQGYVPHMISKIRITDCM